MGGVYHSVFTRLRRKTLSSHSALGDIQLCSYSQLQDSPPKNSLFALGICRDLTRKLFRNIKQPGSEHPFSRMPLEWVWIVKEKGKNVTFTFKAQNAPHPWRNCLALVLITLEHAPEWLCCPKAHRNCPAIILFPKGKRTAHFHKVMQPLSQYQALFLFFPSCSNNTILNLWNIHWVWHMQCWHVCWQDESAGVSKSRVWNCWLSRKEQDLSYDPNNIICINIPELKQELQSCVFI